MLNTVVLFHSCNLFLMHHNVSIDKLGVREVELKAARRSTEVLVSVKVLNPMKTVE